MSDSGDRDDDRTEQKKSAKNSLKPVLKKRQPEPVAYRDKDGNIKVYEEEKAPYIWVKDGSAAPRDTKTPTDSLSSQFSGTGESYTEYPRPDKIAFEGEKVVVPLSPVTEVVLPRKLRRDLIPDDFSFHDIDEHAMKAPPLIKEDLTELVKYLTSFAKTSVEKVRAFYIWITHNINYDTSGYFGRAPLQPTYVETVLKTRLTVCEGYCKLFEAFCREIDIPVTIISGYAKAYGCKPGDDVTKDAHNAHAWNAVFLENGWLLLDLTWGAGFVKAKEKKYVAKFNDAYFLTDPDVFLTDHFPAPVKGFSKYEHGSEWQLVDERLSTEEFCQVLNFDKHGKEWGIEPVTHKKVIIGNFEYEVDIVLQATFIEMLDYVAFIYADDRKLDQYTYTYMLPKKNVNVHVCLPAAREFSLQIFGRSKKNGPLSDYQPIVKYILRCKTAYETPIPYPTHHTLYGPVADLQNYGVREVGNAFQEAHEGELIVSVKPTRYVDILPKLHFGDHSIDLKDYCFVDYSDCFNFMNILLRLRYEGYYKLELLAKPGNSKWYSPFVTYLIKCRKACTDGVFPFANEHAQKYKCCVLEPLSKHLPPNSNISVCIKSPIVTKIRYNDTILEKIDDTTFEGVITTPEWNSKFAIEGCAMDDVFHALYTYDNGIPIEF